MKKKKCLLFVLIVISLLKVECYAGNILEWFRKLFCCCCEEQLILPAPLLSDIGHRPFAVSRNSSMRRSGTGNVAEEIERETDSLNGDN